MRWLQAVGDALSGLLLVEYALGRMGWSLQDWLDLYTDLPSRQLKVPVPDRSIFTTTHAETRLLTPNALQGLVDSSVANVQQGCPPHLPLLTLLHYEIL